MLNILEFKINNLDHLDLLRTINLENAFEYLEFLKKLLKSKDNTYKRIYRHLTNHLRYNDEIHKNSRLLDCLRKMNPEQFKYLLSYFDFRALKSEIWMYKRIAELNVEDGKNILKEEIKQRLLLKDVRDISFILYNYNQFLNNYFSVEELQIMFQEFDYETFFKDWLRSAEVDAKFGSGTLMRMKALELFNQLIEIYKKYEIVNYKQAKEIYKNELIKIFLKGPLEELIEFRSDHYLANLSEQERHNIIEMIDFTKLKLDPTDEKLPLLDEIYCKGTEKVKRVILEKIKTGLIKGSTRSIQDIYDTFLDKQFTEEEILDLFEHLNENKISIDILKNLANGGNPRAIKAYKKRLTQLSKIEFVEKTKSKIIEKLLHGKLKEMRIEISKHIYYFIDQDFEDIFSKLENNQMFYESFIHSFDSLPFSIPVKLLEIFLLHHSKSAQRFFNKIVVKRLKSAKLAEIAFFVRSEYNEYLTHETREIFNLTNKQILEEISLGFENERIPLALVTLRRLSKLGDSAAQVILTEKVQEYYLTGSSAMREFLENEGYVQLKKGCNYVRVPFEKIGENRKQIREFRTYKISKK